MAEIKKLYPGGKTKAFILTYDDGVEEDIKFVGLIEKYNLKGCFNLNFGLMENQFEWKHPSGKTIKRLSLQTAVKLYKNHEIASHTMTHPNLENLKKAGRPCAIVYHYADERIESKTDHCSVTDIPFACGICSGRRYADQGTA